MSVTINLPGVNYSGSYHVLYGPKSGASAYKANVTEFGSGSGVTGYATLWLKLDGTVLAVNYAGQNYTGQQAYNLAGGLTFAVGYEVARATLLSFFTSSPSVHVINETNISIGPTTLSVTNYGATSLPFTVSNCAFSMTFTNFSYQSGHASGSGFALVTYENIAGNEMLSNGRMVYFNDTVRIIAITKA
ncbi:MAG: hypothetical protein OK422_01850 [Thaumarchaeota archaeon]|nr:hypothetical protein [Nitrososphaerota archaeon]